jgi:hypothetical protein
MLLTTTSLIPQRFISSSRRAEMLGQGDFLHHVSQKGGVPWNVGFFYPKL